MQDARSAALGNRGLCVIAISTTTYLAVMIVAFGLRRPGYSHVAQTISELGEFGAADSAWVSWGVFLPVGLAMWVLAIALWAQRGRQPGREAGSALAACIGVGYTVAAFFPCDPGAPLDGSVRTGIHNMGGAVEYLAGALAVFGLALPGGHLRWFYVLAGFTTFVAAVGISEPELAEFRGLIQRFGETSLFGSLILATRPTSASVQPRGT